MRAKDTELHLADIELMEPDEIASMQAEISFKAGMKKVADYANNFAGIKHNPEWQAKLKDWEIGT